MGQLRGANSASTFRGSAQDKTHTEAAKDPTPFLFDVGANLGQSIDAVLSGGR